MCVCPWLFLSIVWKDVFSNVTCLSLCSSQLYEHCRVSAHIWSTLLCCKGTVLLLWRFFFFLFFLTHTHFFSLWTCKRSLDLEIEWSLNQMCFVSFSNYNSYFTHMHNSSWGSFFHFVFQDKQGIPWWLGLSYKGIFQYDHQDKVKPRKVRWFSIWSFSTTTLSVHCTAFTSPFNESVYFTSLN